MSQSELSIAIIGEAESLRIHVMAWGTLSGVRIGALISPEGVAAAELAQTLPDCAAFLTLDDALASERFSLVDVCLPIGLQAEAVEISLTQGIPTMCELPVGLDRETILRLVVLSEKNAVPLFPALTLRFHPAVRFLKDLLENDDLGTPVLTHIHLSPTPSYPSPLEALDLFRYLIQEDVPGEHEQEEIESVSASTTSLPDRLNPDIHAIQLRLGNRLGVITTVARQEGASNRIEIYGSAGFAQTDLDYGQTLYGTALSAIPQTRAESEPASPLALYSEIADTLRGLQPAPVSARDLARAWENMG